MNPEVYEQHHEKCVPFFAKQEEKRARSIIIFREKTNFMIKLQYDKKPIDWV